MTVPNLDALDTDELTAYWSRAVQRRNAAALVGDRRPGYTRIARTLGIYALTLAHAQTARLRDRPADVQRLEHKLAAMYATIPADLRW